MIRNTIARIGALIGAIFFWTWLVVQGVVNWIGRSTVVDDFNLLVERLPGVVGWLYTTPWWVPAGLGSLLTGFLIWLAWPTRPDELVKKGLLALPMESRPTQSAPRGVEELPPLPEFPNSMLVADLEMNLGRVGQPAPWLDFHGVGFNGSRHRLIILSVAGRVRVDGAEFPQEPTLFAAPLAVEPYSLFSFTMNLALNDKGAQFLMGHPGTYSVGFLGTRLIFQRDAQVGNPEALPRYEYRLPSGVSFTRSGGTARPQPTYLQQVGQQRPR